MAIGRGEINQRFGFHPATAETAPVHADIRKRFEQLANYVDRVLEDGREKSCALTSLQEGMMWANAGVAMTAPVAKDPERARK